MKRKPLILELLQTDVAKLKGKWKWATSSVDEANIINLLQFLDGPERIHFMNELWRVLKPSGLARISAPHWCAARAYGDLAFKFPPISESWWPHLNAGWRKANAPWGTTYKCDFDSTGGYGMHPSIVSRNVEYQQHAISFWKEAAQDSIMTLTARK